MKKTVFQGDFSQVHLSWGDQRLVARCAAMEPIAAGRDVYLARAEPRRAARGRKQVGKMSLYIGLAEMNAD
ncbi:MAG: hypothetical protein WA693_16480 [Pseudolabrys sp.]